MKITKKILLGSITALLIVGCTQKAPYTNRSQMIFMSQEEELALGEQSYKQALEKAKVITNTNDAKRIKTIGARIAKAANVSGYKWEFNLVDDDAVNAYCLPGGKVVVYTGILNVAKNDDQLATVISHEIAHALARHGAERMSAAKVQQGVGVIGSVVVGSTAPGYSDIFNQAYGIGSQLGVMLPYGRLQESEADEIGIHLMKKAGYNLNEALNFWENMSKTQKQSNEFFSTHPSSATRIEDIKKVIIKLNGKNSSIQKSTTTNTVNNDLLGKKVY